MTSAQDKGTHGGERVANGLKGGIKGIFGVTEELRTGFNSFLDNTLQPSAKRDADAGVTARHKDDGSKHIFDTADMNQHHEQQQQTGTTTTAATTASPAFDSTPSTTAYPPPPTPPRHDAGVPTTTTTTPTTTATKTGDGLTDPVPEQVAGSGDAGITGNSGTQEQASGHTGYSSDAKKLGESIKHAWQGMRKH